MLMQSTAFPSGCGTACHRPTEVANRDDSSNTSPPSTRTVRYLLGDKFLQPKL